MQRIAGRFKLDASYEACLSGYHHKRKKRHMKLFKRRPQTAPSDGPPGSIIRSMGDIPLRRPESTLFWESYRELVRHALERGNRIHAYDLVLAKEAVSDYIESGGVLDAKTIKAGTDEWMDPDDWNHWMKIQQR
jgi:hypothetical protein